jgi:hypothetical protein
VSKNYAVRLRCPYGDDESWVVLENRSEAVEEILKTPWDFECQIHGAQREFPIEASEQGEGAELAGAIAPSGIGPVNNKYESALSGSADMPSAYARPTGGHTAAFAPPGAAPTYARPGAIATAAAGSISPGTEVRKRASERLALHVPVLIRGWSDAKGGPFRENSLTTLVNTAGALVTLATRVGDTDLLYLANAISREEHEVRVAYVAPEFEGKSEVGLAFKEEAPSFWKRTRGNQRIVRAIPVIVHGEAPNPFTHSAYTVDISKAGARLDGMGFLAQSGAIVEVKRRWHGKARYRVVWVGGVGTPQANQVGLVLVDGGKDVFGEMREEEAKESKKGPR